PQHVRAPVQSLPSVRDVMYSAVLFCPWFVQPFCCQKPRYSPFTASILVSHLAWNIPYNPGTMMRAGNPWAVVRGASFIRTATIAFGFRARSRGIAAVYPSAHAKTIQ